MFATDFDFEGESRNASYCYKLNNKNILLVNLFNPIEWVFHFSVLNTG